MEAKELGRVTPRWQRIVRRVLAAMFMLHGLLNVTIGNRWFGVAQLVLALAYIALEIRDRRREARARLDQFD